MKIQGLKKILTVLAVFLAFEGTAFAADLKVSLDLARTDQENLTVFAKSLRGKHQIQNLIFEFTDSKDASRFLFPTAEGKDPAEEIYKKNYPNGDFYYLIGDLDDDWTKSDYSRYYSVAKWLAMRGFRTIINVAAFVPDLQEAVSNPRTSAIIWNSHGTESGNVVDTAKVLVPKNAFTKNRSKRLKYVLFANCFGDASAKKYGLRDIKGVKSLGWEGTVSSEELFKYLFSEEFDQHLADALNVKSIVKKPQKEVAL